MLQSLHDKIYPFLESMQHLIAGRAVPAIATATPVIFQKHQVFSIHVTTSQSIMQDQVACGALLGIAAATQLR